MFKYIKSILLFILPILGKEALKIGADVLTTAAYGEKKAPAVDFPEGIKQNKWGQQRPSAAPGFETYHDVVMVAFDITGQSREAAYRFLCDNMPVAKYHVDSDISIDSWWIADDEFDGSDCDSAIFVPKGRQGEAREFLGRNFPTDPQF